MIQHLLIKKRSSEVSFYEVNAFEFGFYETSLSTFIYWEELIYLRRPVNSSQMVLILPGRKR